jgi:uncharacterized OB-fold protein
MGAFVSAEVFLQSVPSRYRLLASRCPSGHTTFPEATPCRVCGQATEGLPLSKHAELLAFTAISPGASPGEYASEQISAGVYYVGVVQFPEGPRLTVRLTEMHGREPVIGMPVEAVFRRLYEQQGVVRYGVKLAPMAPAAHPPKS